MTAEFAEDFARWILMDVGYRQDQHGNRPSRGQRRTTHNKPMQVYSRKVLDPTSAPDSWGLCWQPYAKHIRGDDAIFRITLAVMALQESGESNYKACVVVASVIDNNCNSKNIEQLRARVYKYIKSCDNRNISLLAYLEMMTSTYRYSQLDGAKATAG